MEDYTDDPGNEGSSIAGPLIRALLAAAVAFGVYWLVFGQDDPAEDVAVEPTTTEATPAPTVPPEPTTTPPTIDPAPTPTITGDPGLPEQPGQGVSAQVLNGTDDQAVFDDAVQTLVDFGYDVTESGRAANDYAVTTIFATEGHEDDAQALQQADPRFTTIGENPGNLTTEIDIHVVIGQDWTTTAGGSTATPTDATPTPTPTDG